jgi:hypothetical protein
VIEKSARGDGAHVDVAVPYGGIDFVLVLYETHNSQHLPKKKSIKLLPFFCTVE